MEFFTEDGTTLPPVWAERGWLFEENMWAQLPEVHRM